MAEKEVKDYEGLINRASGIFGLLKYFPDDMSDEEVEGILHVLPKDMASTIEAVMAPRIRKIQHRPAQGHPEVVRQCPGGQGAREEDHPRSLQLPAGVRLLFRECLSSHQRGAHGTRGGFIGGAGREVLGLRHGAGPPRLPVFVQHHRAGLRPHRGRLRARRGHLGRPGELRRQLQDPRVRGALPGRAPVPPGQAGGRLAAGA